MNPLILRGLLGPVVGIIFVVPSLCSRCPFLHRTAGDTERRYHLRYYKTGSCIHETDAKGHCSKNGSHCAFAHGSHDLRSPVYDIRCFETPTATPPSTLHQVPYALLLLRRRVSQSFLFTEKCRSWSLREARGPQREAEGMGSRDRQRVRPS